MENLDTSIKSNIKNHQRALPNFVGNSTEKNINQISVNDKIEIPILIKRRHIDGGPITIKTPIWKVVNHIRYGLNNNKPAPTGLHYRWTPNPKKIFARTSWRGKSANISNEYTGLICIGITGLIETERSALIESIRTDLYATIAFSNSWQDGIWIIVKTDCKAYKDEMIYYNFLQNYYTSKYGITNDKFDKEYRNSINCNYPLNYDPDVYYNPNSRLFCVTPYTDGETLAYDKLDNSSSPNQKDTADYTDESAIGFLKENSLFNNERETASLLPTFHTQYEWYMANFLNTKPIDSQLEEINSTITEKRKSNNQKIIAILQLDENSQYLIVDINIYPPKNKQDNIVFQFDPKTGHIIVGGKRQSRSVATNQLLDDEKVGHYLAQLLAKGELIHGDVKRLIENKLGCKDRTARSQLKRFLSEPSLLQSIVDKPIRLVERRDGKHHYLFLEDIK